MRAEPRWIGEDYKDNKGYWKRAVVFCEQIFDKGYILGKVENMAEKKKDSKESKKENK